MAINAVVVRKPVNVVVVNKSPTGPLVTSGDPVTVTASPIASIDTINELQDVNLTGLANGDVLVYNAATGKWVAQNPVSGGGAIDGGSF